MTIHKLEVKQLQGISNNYNQQLPEGEYMPGTLRNTLPVSSFHTPANPMSQLQSSKTLNLRSYS